MSDKPFLTIDEQVRLLESRGLDIDEDTGPTLMREGYYSIVNGYKGFKRFIKELTELLMRYVETYAIKHVLNQIGFVELLQKTSGGSLFE